MIILNYPKYVGGKFIANCLALSKHCVVQNLDLAEQDIQSSDSGYYEFKLATVLNTLPTRENMVGWGGYEFGCDQLYGVDESFYINNSVEDVKKYIENLSILQKLQKANKESCLIAHDYVTLLKYKQVYPTAKIVEFSNFDQFRLTALQLKDPNPSVDRAYISSADVYNQMRETYKFDSYVIDVDGTFFPWASFEPMIQGLYEYLGFDDFNPDLVRSYWNRYINLHR